MNRLRNERGQAAVLTILFLVVLLGAVALTLDVGSWFREQRDTQSAADAAALAGAHALPDNPGQAQVLAAEYLAKNGGGDATVTFPEGKNAIRVRVERNTPGIFAQVFGIDSVDVAAQATARVGNPGEAKWAGPFGVDEKHPFLHCSPAPCWGSTTRLDLDKVGPGAFRLINIDGSKGGTGPPILADWITRGFDGYMPLGWYYSDPGAKFNSSQVTSAMNARLGKEQLFPVYRSIKGNGSNLQYEIVGWVGFVVTSYQFKGSKQSWLDGYFTRVIWEGILNQTGSANYGVRAIELVE